MHEVPLYKPDLLYRTNYFKNSGSLDSSQQETVDDVVAASCRGSLLHVGPPPPHTHSLTTALFPVSSLQSITKIKANMLKK